MIDDEWSEFNPDACDKIWDAWHEIWDRNLYKLWKRQRLACSFEEYLEKTERQAQMDWQRIKDLPLPTRKDLENMSYLSSKTITRIASEITKVGEIDACLCLEENMCLCGIPGLISQDNATP